MGREIRMVIPNWEHPIRDCRHWPMCGGGKCPQPLYDRDFKSAVREWKRSFKKWVPKKEDGFEYWEVEGFPPEREYYRPSWKKQEASWVQVYETVSEGTPVTPAFATPEELVEYLVKFGDYWDQERNRGGWDRKNAEEFVKRGWAPSLMVNRTDTECTMKEPRDGI